MQQNHAHPSLRTRRGELPHAAPAAPRPRLPSQRPPSRPAIPSNPHHATRHAPRARPHRRQHSRALSPRPPGQPPAPVAPLRPFSGAHPSAPPGAPARTPHAPAVPPHSVSNHRSPRAPVTYTHSRTARARARKQGAGAHRAARFSEATGRLGGGEARVGRVRGPGGGRGGLGGQGPQGPGAEAARGTGRPGWGKARAPECVPQGAWPRCPPV